MPLPPLPARSAPPRSAPGPAEFLQLAKFSTAIPAQPAQPPVRRLLFEQTFPSSREILKVKNRFYSWRNRLARQNPAMQKLSRQIALSINTKALTISIFSATPANPFSNPSRKSLMSKAKKISRYSADIIALALHTGNQKTTITLPDETSAHALRFELYGLKRAITHENAEAQFADFMRAQFLIKGNTLTITPPELNIWTESLAKALTTPSATPPDTPSTTAAPAAPSNPYIDFIQK